MASVGTSHDLCLVELQIAMLEGDGHMDFSRRPRGWARGTYRGQDANDDERVAGGLCSISAEHQRSSRSRSTLLRQLTVDVMTAPTSRAALRAPARWKGSGTRAEKVLSSRSRPWRQGPPPHSTIPARWPAARGGGPVGGTVDEIPSGVPLGLSWSLDRICTASVRLAGL